MKANRIKWNDSMVNNCLFINMSEQTEKDYYQFVDVLRKEREERDGDINPLDSLLSTSYMDVFVNNVEENSYVYDFGSNEESEDNEDVEVDGVSYPNHYSEDKVETIDFDTVSDTEIVFRKNIEMDAVTTAKTISCIGSVVEPRLEHKDDNVAETAIKEYTHFEKENNTDSYTESITETYKENETETYIETDTETYAETYIETEIEEPHECEVSIGYQSKQTIQVNINNKQGVNKNSFSNLSILNRKKRYGYF